MAVLNLTKLGACEADSIIKKHCSSTCIRIVRDIQTYYCIKKIFKYETTRRHLLAELFTMNGMWHCRNVRTQKEPNFNHRFSSISRQLIQILFNVTHLRRLFHANAGQVL